MSEDAGNQQLEPCPLPEPLRTVAQMYCQACLNGTVETVGGSVKVLPPHRSRDPVLRAGSNWFHRVIHGQHGYGCAASMLYELNSRVSDGGVVATSIAAALEEAKNLVMAVSTVGRYSAKHPRELRADCAAAVEFVAKKYATASPAAPKDHDSCSHWREGDSDNCVWCGDDLGPTTEADVAGSAAPKEEAQCYWCKHPDHGEKVCPVPYLARGEHGLAGSYPCGCTQSTMLTTTPSPDAAREAARHYFCSCGGALTVEEYIEHYFDKGHDRGEPRLLARAAAKEIQAWLGVSGLVDGEGLNEVAAIIQRHCFTERGA